MKHYIHHFSFWVAFLMAATFAIDATAQFADCDPDSPAVRYRSRDFIPGTPIVITDLAYGTNGDQTLDLYLPPVADTETNRPLMIWAHPGGFITGDKGYPGAVLWCETMAKMGYVVASINYRQDLIATAATGATVYFIGTGGGAIRGVYLAIQDARSAIRYLRNDAAIYGIDPNTVLFAGSSAGAVIAANVAYMQGSERPSVTQGNFFPWRPNLGCLDCGEFAAVDNSTHNGNITAGAVLWGGVEDYEDGDDILDVIDDFNDADGDGEIDTEPMLFLHGADDLTVQPGKGPPFVALGGGLLLPDMYGTYPIRERLNSLGADAPQWEAYVLCNEDHEFELDQQEGGNGEFGSTGVQDENYDYVVNEVTDHFYQAMNPSMPETGPIETIVDNGAGLTLDACDTSSKGTYAPTAYSTYRVSSPNPGSDYCWDITKGTILTGQGTPEITVRWSDIPNAGGAANINDAVGRTGTVLCYEKTTSGGVETVHKASHHLSLIVDGAATAPVANFSSALSSGTTYDFTDASTNADHPTDTYEWDFGDGTTMIGTTANPSHTYSSNGSYTVTLTVMNQCGNRSDYLQTIDVMSISPKVFLQGPFNGTDMNTDLNTASLIPSTEPYTALGFTGLQNAGTGFASSYVPGTGGDVITDWVVVELRNPTTPTIIVERKAALLQKDGDVVDIDGVSPVGFFNVTVGTYHVVVRHRNHLGVMTGTPILLN